MSRLQSFAIVATCGILGFLAGHPRAGTFAGITIVVLLVSFDARGAKRR